MINCTITSPKETTIYTDTSGIKLPALSGQMQILPGHAESFIILGKGTIVVQQLNKPDQNIQIMGGECHFKNDIAVIIL